MTKRKKAKLAGGKLSSKKMRKLMRRAAPAVVGVAAVGGAIASVLGSSAARSRLREMVDSVQAWARREAPEPEVSSAEVSGSNAEASGKPASADAARPAPRSIANEA